MRSPASACRLALAAALVLLLAACSLSVQPGGSGSEPIVVGQDQLLAQQTSLQGVPALPRARAISLAEGYVPTWRQASAITARYVALTLRSSGGTVAWGVQGCPVWLVQFKGARYAPVAYPESDCACDRSFQPPSTAVALDAQSGTLVMDFGFPSSAAR